MRNPFEVTYSFKIVDESLDSINPNIVYICKNEGRIDFICPCGCLSRIILNTLIGAKPLWKFVEPDSISPSVQRIVGCLSHFTITSGITHK